MSPFLSDLEIVIKDAVGADVQIQARGVSTMHEKCWHRPIIGEGLTDMTVPIDHLARLQRNVFANIAINRDESVYVLPGSHFEQLSSEFLEMMQRDSSAEIPGEVRIRLSPGDVWFYNGCLAMRSRNDKNKQRLTLQITGIPDPT